MLRVHVGSHSNNKLVRSFSFHELTPVNLVPTISLVLRSLHDHSQVRAAPLKLNKRTQC